MKTFNKLLPWLIAFCVIILGGYLLAPQASSQIEDATNFTGVHIKSSALGTATPQNMIWNQGNSRSFEIRDTGGTPEVVVNSAGAMTINSLTLSTVTAPVIGYPTPGILCNKKSNTITDTAAYTSTVTAITTPAWASCTMSTITGDAAHCAASVGTPGAVSVIVRNVATTPVANSVGALVFWEVCGTN
jgi:hypothetical protein